MARAVAPAAAGAGRVVPRRCLEAVVDLHTFPRTSWPPPPAAPARSDVQVETTELTASWFGWPVRTFECAVRRERLGLRWAKFAMTSWQRLSALDEVLAQVVPAGLFYNVEITGLKPRSPKPGSES